LEVAIVKENDIMKYEIAEELGLTEKVNTTGWKSLTAKESGRIGGILAKRKRQKECAPALPEGSGNELCSL